VIGRKISTKEAVVVLLFAGLAVTLYVQYSRGALSGSAAPRASARAGGKPVEAEDLPALIEVSLEPPPPAKIRRETRNLFNYARSPAEIEAEDQARAAAERQQREEAERRRVQAEADARARAERERYERDHPTPAPPPPINFRFIGKMGDPKAPIAILEEVAAGGEKYVVREGEVVLDKYKIIKIEFDSVTIGYTNPQWAQDTKTLKMGG